MTSLALKIDIKFIPKWNEKTRTHNKWMEIHIKNGTNVLIPSFEDWHAMLQALRECEREKYKYVGDPVRMPMKFFWDCLYTDASYEELRRKYTIPDREFERWKKALVGSHEGS